MINDVAVWRLEKPIEESETIGYAELPKQGQDPIANSTVTIAGWYVLLSIHAENGVPRRYIVSE